MKLITLDLEHSSNQNERHSMKAFLKYAGEVVVMLLVVFLIGKLRTGHAQVSSSQFHVGGRYRYSQSFRYFQDRWPLDFSSYVEFTRGISIKDPVGLAKERTVHIVPGDEILVLDMGPSWLEGRIVKVIPASSEDHEAKYDDLFKGTDGLLGRWYRVIYTWPMEDVWKPCEDVR